MLLAACHVQSLSTMLVRDNEDWATLGQDVRWRIRRGVLGHAAKKERENISEMEGVRAVYEICKRACGGVGSIDGTLQRGEKGVMTVGVKESEVK